MWSARTAALPCKVCIVANKDPFKGNYAPSGNLPPAVQPLPPPSTETAEIVVACIDVAAGGNLGAAAALFTCGGRQAIFVPGSGYTYSAGGTRQAFITDLAGHLRGGGLVALGFEAPLWGTWDAPPTGGTPLPALSGRPGVDAPNRPWYNTAVASEVGPLAVEVLSALGQPAVTSGLHTTPAWNATCPVLVWEAYITDARCCVSTKGALIAGLGQQEPSSHRQDACCGVLHGFVNLAANAAAANPAFTRTRIIPTLEWALVANGLAAPGAIGAPTVIEPAAGGAQQLWP